MRGIRRLSSKFLLLTVPVSVLAAAVFLFGITWFKRIHDERNLHTMLVQQARRDADLVSRAVWTVDEPAVRVQLSSFVDSTWVSCVRLLGVAYLSSKQIEAGACTEGSAPEMRLLTPVLLSENGVSEQIGELEHWVEIRASSVSLLTQLQPLIVLLLLFLAVLSASALLAFRLAVGEPLAQVRRSIRTYRNRGVREPVRWRSDDELGEFIREFNAALVRQETTESDLKEQAAFQQALRETMPTAFAFLDARLHVFEANAAFQAAFGESTEHDDPQPLSTRLRGPDWTALKQIPAGKVHRQDLHDLPTAAGPRSFVLSASLLQNSVGLFQGIVTVWQDVTDSVRSLAALSQERRNAEDALSRLRTAQQSLVQSEKFASLGGLVAGIAHEINTPLGISVTASSHLHESVNTLQQTLEQGALKRSDLVVFLADANEANDILERALDAATLQIRRFKQVSADQASSMRRPFDLGLTLNDVLVTLRPAIKNTAHRLRVELESGIAMDSYPGPLGQVLTNCFNNAVLHAFENIAAGEIVVRARLVAVGRVRLCIADNGRGIPPENLSRVFDPFYTTRLGRGGSGLGMHLVYSLVTGVLGGEVRLESTPGQGTEVIIELPCVAPESQG